MNHDAVNWYVFVRDRRPAGIGFPMCDVHAQVQRVPEGLCLQVIAQNVRAECDACAGKKFSKSN